MYFMLMSLFHISIRVASGSYHIGSIKSDLLLQYPEFHKEIEFFVQHDPSHKSKYLKWQLKILSSGQAKEQEILDVTELFDKYGQNLLKKDIYQYSHEDFTDLRDELFKIRDKKEEREKKVDDRYKLIDHPDSEQIYESEKYLVLWIKNKAASIHHGQDTKWCISMKGKGYFEDYESSNVVFFFVLNKQEDEPKLKILGLIARSPNAPLEILYKLSQDKNKNVRAYVAQNPNTSSEILAQLSQDEYVRGCVAQNPNTSSEILAQLSQERSSYVRAYVAQNPNTR